VAGLLQTNLLAGENSKRTVIKRASPPMLITMRYGACSAFLSRKVQNRTKHRKPCLVRSRTYPS